MLVAEVDSKLLLAIQYACEKASIAVPWDDIAHVMGRATTGCGILDHLATTRTRMIARGLEVPPRLNFPSKIKKVNRKTPSYSNEFGDNDEAWDINDLDIESGDPIAKRAKMSTRVFSSRKVNGDTDEGGHMNAEVIIPGLRRVDLEHDYASHPKTDTRTLYKKGLVVSSASTKKDVHEAVVHNRKVMDTIKSGSEHHHVRGCQTKGPDVPPPLEKMKIAFVVSPTPTKKDVHDTVGQKPNVVTKDNQFSGAHDWSMGNPIPYSYQSGLRERFQQLHERYPDPATTSAGRDDTTRYSHSWRCVPQSNLAGFESSAENENRNVDGNYVDNSLCGSNGYGN